MKYIQIAIAGVLSAVLTPAILLAATIYPKATLLKPTVQCVNGKPQITITWNKVSGATAYSVFRLQKPQTQWLTRYSMISGIKETDIYVLNGTEYEYQIKTYFPGAATYSNIISVATPNCTQLSASSEIKFTGYITGYGYPDNTPAGTLISNPVIHASAGGTGTYTDPITIAAGHSIMNGQDILDYPAGTKFYIPALRRYFIVEDTCGDGSAPQNGPCHTGYQGNVWLDAWVGGMGANASSVYACENAITGMHMVIKNPSANYAVVSGPLFNNVCTTLFSDTPVVI